VEGWSDLGRGRMDLVEPSSEERQCGDFGHLGVVQHVAAMTSLVGCRAPLRGGVGGLLGEVAMRPRPA
jgi:hypothetical protein